MAETADVTFLKSYRSYNAGDSATFPADVAAALIFQKKARAYVPPVKAKDGAATYGGAKAK